MKLETASRQIRKFYGKKSQTAQVLVPLIYSSWKKCRMNPAYFGQFHEWLSDYNKITGAKWRKVEKGIREYWDKILYFDDTQEFLFCLKTYYVLVIKELTNANLKARLNLSIEDKRPTEAFRFLIFQAGLSIEDFSDPFTWFEEAIPIYDLIDIFTNTTHRGLSSITAFLQPDLFGNTLISTSEDVLYELYQDLFPKKVRHQLGEYYTPPYLASLLLEKIELDGDKTCLDPACGSGIFLVSVARELVKAGQSLEKILTSIEGYDINPLAILSSTVNVIFAVNDLLPSREIIRIPVYQRDSLFPLDIPSLFEQQETRFDYVIGNPPWISWKHIEVKYRERLKKLALPYDLFEYKGMKARLGFAQDDISVLFTYLSIDKYLKDSGILGFVLPQTLLKTEGGGRGFRKFRLGNKGTPFRIDTVEDMSKINIFGTNSSKAMIFIAQKGRENSYPVKYNIWSKRRNRLTKKSLAAEPISDLSSAWITASKGAINIVKDIKNASFYRARAGVCTWASSIYWLKPLEMYDDKVLIENYTASSRQMKVKKRALIEKELLFPLIRGRELSRWENKHNLWILNIQDPENLSRAMPEQIMQDKYPLAYAYLLEFKDYLRERKGYKKYLFNQPFYAVYDIGPYTFSSYKTCWKYLDTDINASVLEPFRNQPVIPDLNVITIPANSIEEAHYLSAMLNSPPVRLIVHAYGLCTRISPGIMDNLPIPRFCPSNALHLKLSQISMAIHNDKMKKFDEELLEFSAEIIGYRKKAQEIKDNLQKIIRD